MNSEPERNIPEQVRWNTLKFYVGGVQWAFLSIRLGLLKGVWDNLKSAVCQNQTMKNILYSFLLGALSFPLHKSFLNSFEWTKVSFFWKSDSTVPYAKGFLTSFLAPEPSFPWLRTDMKNSRFHVIRSHPMPVISEKQPDKMRYVTILYRWRVLSVYIFFGKYNF